MDKQEVAFQTASLYAACLGLGLNLTAASKQALNFVCKSSHMYTNCCPQMST